MTPPARTATTPRPYDYCADVTRVICRLYTKETGRPADPEDLNGYERNALVETIKIALAAVRYTLIMITEDDHDFIVDQLTNALEHEQDNFEFASWLADKTELPLSVAYRMVTTDGPAFLKDPFHDFEYEKYYLIK